MTLAISLYVRINSPEVDAVYATSSNEGGLMKSRLFSDSSGSVIMIQGSGECDLIVGLIQALVVVVRHTLKIVQYKGQTCLVKQA